ncbi:MAG: thioredoxin family protein [Vicinamibacteria bacterium]|nr:thioredoxin family protein [Vicinamibacteria bacterium]
MAMLSDRDRKAVQDRLRQMAGPVKLVYFTQELECPACRETSQILRELSETSDKLTLESYNFQIDRETVEKYRVDKIPATVVEGAKDAGIRFYGMPAGYEFASLLEAVLIVAAGESGLSDATIDKLKRIDKPVRLEVLVTPTCPYCPAAVTLAHRLAMASEHVTADMVEATEFPYLVQKYRVMGVPRTVVNETVYIDGAVPEAAFVDRLIEAVAKAN